MRTLIVSYSHTETNYELVLYMNGYEVYHFNRQQIDTNEIELWLTGGIAPVDAEKCKEADEENY